MSPSKLIIFISLLLLFNNNIILAQEQKQESSSKTAIQLAPGKIKAFEGYFQSGGNQEMYVQFTAAENTLLAKTLWNNRQLKLYPSSESEFFSTEGDQVTIKFIKGDDGVVKQFLLNGQSNNQWNKVKEYKPVTHKEMTHTPAQLKVFEGVYSYHNENTTFVEFKEKDNKLILKELWDAQETPFVPESELDFFSPEQPMATVTFSKDSMGAISKVLAFKRDLWYKVPPVQLSVDQLRGLTGKFRSKDDPDNVILISIKGNGLVVKQMWDKKEIAISPKSTVFFYNDEQSFPVLFLKEKDGSVYRMRILDANEFERMKE